MRERTGNIWKLAGPFDWVVIPTSLSFRADGTAVLGAGLARQAAERWPDLPVDYGEQLFVRKANTPVLAHRPRGMNPRNLILFPTKPFNPQAPHLGWRSPSDLELVQKSLQQLHDLVPSLQGGLIYIPDVGCGHGGLPLAIVRQKIDEQFKAMDRVVHVRSR